MAIVPLYGHEELRARLAGAVGRNSLPATLLLQGPRGVGKQRLALWLAQLLLCERPSKEPCGECRGCRFSLGLTHPDQHWFFPRSRPKDTDPDLDDVRNDVAAAVAERAEEGGLYPPPSGMDGIFIATTRLVVQQAALSPAMARRKVFIIGDADRMVPQEGKEEAANAFLKLLEEPPGDTTIILTSSEPGALLPTVRSRSVCLRVSGLSPADVRRFLADERVQAYLEGDKDLPASVDERLSYAGGAPGRLLAGEMWQDAVQTARRMLDSVTGKPASRYEAAWTTSSSKARGAFADTLDALTIELHQRARIHAKRGSEGAALAATHAIEAVEVAKERILTNVSPQLITVNLLRELQELLS